MKDVDKEPKIILRKHKKLLLQLDNSKSERFSKIKKIHKFIDEHNSEIIKKDSVCVKGCAYCCYMNVDITEIEASYISKYTKRQLNNNINNSVYADISKFADIPCPFLDINNNACTIYDIRPSVCRMYHVFESSEKCKTKKGQKEINISSSSIIEPLFTDYLANRLSNNEVLKNSYNGLRDIREWFN